VCADMGLPFGGAPGAATYLLTLRRGSGYNYRPSGR
jgi:hypothetical protein